MHEAGQLDGFPLVNRMLGGAAVIATRGELDAIAAVAIGMVEDVVVSGVPQRRQRPSCLAAIIANALSSLSSDPLAPQMFEQRRGRAEGVNRERHLSPSLAEAIKDVMPKTERAASHDFEGRERAAQIGQLIIADNAGLQPRKQPFSLSAVAPASFRGYFRHDFFKRHADESGHRDDLHYSSRPLPARRRCQLSR
jgi:hypothetical protein